MALPTNSVSTTHVLKPEPQRFPGLVDNEAFCMTLARMCELAVARITKAKTVSGTPFVTKTVSDLLDRAAVEAPALTAISAHDNAAARRINERIQHLAGR